MFIKLLKICWDTVDSEVLVKLRNPSQNLNLKLRLGKSYKGHPLLSLSLSTLSLSLSTLSLLSLSPYSN